MAAVASRPSSARSSSYGKGTSVYLTQEESARLNELADRTGLARNAIHRIALRRLLGLPRVSSSRVEAILDQYAATS